jgi:hypothetical protein
LIAQTTSGFWRKTIIIAAHLPFFRVWRAFALMSAYEGGMLTSLVWESSAHAGPRIATIRFNLSQNPGPQAA